MTELRFDGRVAVVTGSGGGLGRAYALLLASRGAKVVVNDPGVSRHGEGGDAGPAQSVVDEIRAAGGEAAVSTDSVATPEGGQAIIDTAVKASIFLHPSVRFRGRSSPQLWKCTCTARSTSPARRCR